MKSEERGNGSNDKHPKMETTGRCKDDAKTSKKRKGAAARATRSHQKWRPKGAASRVTRGPQNGDKSARRRGHPGEPNAQRQKSAVVSLSFTCAMCSWQTNLRSRHRPRRAWGPSHHRHRRVVFDGGPRGTADEKQWKTSKPTRTSNRSRFPIAFPIGFRTRSSARAAGRVPGHLRRKKNWR